MATKTEVVQFIAEYVTKNERPCPKAAVIMQFGESALELLKGAAADGSVAARRGRNGGYKPTSPVATANEDASSEAENAPASDESSEVDVDSFAAQFRALEARMAAEEAAQAESNAD